MEKKLNFNKVLLLIDQAPVRSFIQGMLNDHAYGATFCTTWQEAEELLKSEQYSIFVSDTDLLINEITHSMIFRASETFETKTVMVLSDDDLKNIRAAKNTGDHIYYPKGLRPKLLWLVVNSLIAELNEGSTHDRWIQSAI